MKKIIILGASGLIGHKVFMYLNKSDGYKIFTFANTVKVSGDTILLNARNETQFEEAIKKINPDIIVNCMGVLIENARKNPEHAIFLNAYMPHHLKNIANILGAKLIHISTDCVFSGNKGSYVESDIKDANDIYGRAKGLGEVTELPHLTIRTSVVGPQLKAGNELFHWFMCQKESVKGFTKAIWSGVTTLELSKAIEWAIEKDIQGLYHLTNGQSISKFELLTLFKKHTGKCIDIKKVEGRVTDKSLIDTRKEMNYQLPSYEEMIQSTVLDMKQNKVLYTHYF